MIEIQKNRRELIRVQQKEIGGRLFVDLRIYFEGKAGDLLPSKKGITIDISQAGDLARAIQQVAGNSPGEDS